MYKNQKGNFHPISGIIIIIAVTVLIAYYIGTQKNLFNKTQSSTTNLSPQQQQQTYSGEYPYGTTYKIISGCNSDSCLFASPSENGVVEGFAKLEGYYHVYNSEDFGNKVTCTSLLVTGGNENLIKSLRDQIEKGNTVNKIDESNNLLVNIKTEDLKPQTKSLIESSDANNQIELNVIRITPAPRGASTCSNFVEIISAELL